MPDDAGEFVPPLADHEFDADEHGHNCAVCVERDDDLNKCWPQNHPCPLCETRPRQLDDVFCPTCRLDCMNSSDIVHDPVEQALSSHQHVCYLSDIDRTMCRCGEQFEGGPGYWRHHLATMIYEALGIDGPVPWLLGADSATPDEYGERQPRVEQIGRTRDA